MNYYRRSVWLSTARRKRALISEMNIVPYVDVMLVLLVVFMITTPLLSQGVQIELPQAQANTLTLTQPMPLVVSIDAMGRYYLNVNSQAHTSMPAPKLLTRVAAELQLAKQSHQAMPMVLVKGDKHLNYDYILHTMALLQQAGVPRVGLVVQHPV